MICFLYGLHVISINRTLPINNNIPIIIYRWITPYSLILHPLFFLSFFSLLSPLLLLFHNMLSARCSNQLKTSGSCFSLTTVLYVSQFRLLLIISQFIILPYILSLVIRIVWLYQFSSPSYYLFLLWRWLLLILLFWWLLLLILLFYVIVLNTRNVAKFGFLTLDITRKNSLYRTLNVEIHLDAMDIGIPFNKELKHLSN